MITSDDHLKAWHLFTDGIVSIRKLHNEVMGIGDHGSLDYFSIAGMRISKADVVFYRPMKKKDLLKDDTDLRAQFLDIQVTKVYPVKRDVSWRDIIKPGDQADQSRFANPGWADQGDNFPGRDGQVDIS